MMTPEQHEAAVWGEYDAAQALYNADPTDERAQEIWHAAQARARAFTSDCQACRKLTTTCLACRKLQPSPPERGAPGRCVCGALLRRRVGGYGCPGCGSAFMEETNAER